MQPAYVLKQNLSLLEFVIFPFVQLWFVEYLKQDIPCLSELTSGS